MSRKDIFLQKMESFDSCVEYVKHFYENPALSDFRFGKLDDVQYNLKRAIEKPGDHAVLGVVQSDVLIGLFCFLVLREENYLEMTVGLSDQQNAYRCVFSYLEKNYPNCKIDFVFNPKNVWLKDSLAQKDAEFEQEHQEMVFRVPAPNLDTTGIILFSQEYAKQYQQIHCKNVYWTGEKVMTAPDRFRTFLALCEEEVVGYIDVTHCFSENEPYHIFVLDEYRRMGYGRKLLAAALKMNEPSGMMLNVDVDNQPAISLYSSIGFVKTENGNGITAHWVVSGNP